MELEGLLNGNKILIYFIGIMYILVNESFDKKQKIIMVYIFTYVLKLFSIMDVKIMIIVLSVVTFLYIGYLTKDNVKNNILCSIWDKVKDCFYKCVFEYSSIYFLISIILMSNMVKNSIPLLKFISININLLEIKINIISIILLSKALTNISSQKYETNSFENIKKRMDEIAIWTNLYSEFVDKEKLNMLIDIEDKSYFLREKSYNFFSIEFFRYRLNKKKTKKINLGRALKKILFKKLHITRKLKKYIRGYSTIEMQIIRTLGIKHGYRHFICRKIYEVLYSKMYFKNLRKYMNKSHLNTEGCCQFKEYLLFVYIGIAPIKLNNRNYDDMLSVWKTKQLNDVTKEQFFISILGLSNRKISNEIIYNYNGIVDKYNLNENELEKIIKELNN